MKKCVTEVGITIKFVKFLCMAGLFLFLMGCGSEADEVQTENEEGIEFIIKAEMSDVEAMVLKPLKNGLKIEDTLSENLPEEMKKPDWVWLEEKDDETDFTMEGAPLLEFYYPEGGELFLKLYYDEETGTGSGISYGYGAENNKIGFHFYTTKDWDFALEDPYDFSKWTYYEDGTAAVENPEDFEGIANYHEQIVYDENEKPLHFEAAGDYERYEWETDYSIIKIDYDYREDGSLFKKRCEFDPLLFGTYASTRTIYYDEAGRTVYMGEYITHGDIQRYYVYESDQDIPTYCFVFDSGWDAFMVKYK